MSCSVTLSILPYWRLKKCVYIIILKVVGECDSCNHAWLYFYMYAGYKTDLEEQ